MLSCTGGGGGGGVGWRRGVEGRHKTAVFAVFVLA